MNSTQTLRENAEPEAPARAEATTSLDLRTVARRALSKRCARCGETALFATYAKLHPSCSACGHVHRRESGASTGSMYVSAGVTQLFAVFVVLFLWFATDWTVGQGILFAVVTVGGFSYAFLPYSIAIWSAVEYWTDVHNGERWADPVDGK